ncbi:uncharacterized protein LOC129712414 isoform X2 [Leucoraja erinacea]|uniref:uncharacterized protein LOC129712414 isoform X2 n=1 Tax=Leucoraja erinaceus TaxID=7782 RepID=UPI002458B6C2|nr:uncharacterized protein LOC129712414 isoform X2 [Leucoraja erinacea]
MVQKEGQLKKNSLFRRMLFSIIRICKLSEIKTEDDPDDYMNLVDRLRDRNLVLNQVPVSERLAKAQVNQHGLPCGNKSRETRFVGKKKRKNEKNVKYPQCPLEYFINWHKHLDHCHPCPAVNNEQRGTPAIGKNILESEGGVSDYTIFSAEDKLHDGESNYPPHSVGASGNQCRKDLKTLNRGKSPTLFGKHWKSHSFNPFSGASQYRVLDVVTDPLECQEVGSKLFLNTVPQKIKEPDQTLLTN